MRLHAVLFDMICPHYEFAYTVSLHRPQHLQQRLVELVLPLLVEGQLDVDG